MTRTLKLLVIHSIIAMPVSVMCAIIGGVFIRVVMQAVGIGATRAADVWYGPFVWWPGLALGFLVNRRTLHRAACFVWFPGLLWLAWGIYSQATGWRPEGMSWMTRVRIDLFPLKQGECGMTECLYVLSTTYPALNSITYSVGAVLALISQGKAKGEGPFTGHPTLGLG